MTHISLRTYIGVTVVLVLILTARVGINIVHQVHRQVHVRTWILLRLNYAFVQFGTHERRVVIVVSVSVNIHV